MKMVSGVDMSRVVDNANKAYVKAVEARVADYLRGLMFRLHNEQMKAARLRMEAEQIEAGHEKLAQQIEDIKAGKWDAIDHLDVTDKQGKEGGA